MRQGQLSYEQKRRFVETLVDRISITPDGKANAAFRFDGHYQRSKEWSHSYVNEERYGCPFV